MLKLVLVTWAIACSQLSFGMRVKKQSAIAAAKADATTKWDILLCDSMCMQCPSGRNILITRQKGTLHSAIALSVGAVTWGLGMPVVNQLAGCNAIGFDFWKNRQEEEDQPLRTKQWFGWLFPHGGLETLEDDMKISGEDAEALEYCKRLADPFLWQAVRGAFNSDKRSGFEQQQEFARRCLSHSSLCGSDSKWGPEEMDKSALNVARINPFADVHMCSKPKDGEDWDPATYGMPSVDPALGTEDSGTEPVGGEDSSGGANTVEATASVGPGNDLVNDIEDVIEDNVDAGDEDEDRDLTAPEPDRMLSFPDRMLTDENFQTTLTLPEEEDEEILADDDTNDDTANAGNGNAGDAPNKDGVSNGGTHNAGSVGDGDAEEDLTVPDEKEILNDADLSANTVEAAGHLINQWKNGDDGSGGQGEEFFGLTRSDSFVSKVAYKLCHFDEKQQRRCDQLNLNHDTCTDRCCLDVCKFYTSKPSCIRKCVQKSGKR